MWEYLYEQFRGGPVVNQLHVCAICQQEKDTLEAKRNEEREAFQKVVDANLQIVSFGLCEEFRLCFS